MSFIHNEKTAFLFLKDAYKNILDVNDNCTDYIEDEFVKKIRADERASVIEEVKKLKNQVPVNRLLDNIVKEKPKELGMLIAYDEVLKVLEQNTVKQ